ncbi:broad specificity phosphatase PhoE [Azorhizobium sp. AG788]|uniref:histidine phosphatase family protein n=1 Tax=Azorhizobium sp. AG788 TaxID=2183897 RepID=UPI00105C5265|nr:histidine phosphatase family protein [Azorhizobium sp. AG788]TDT94485.1 broad specificity phosphatase PhoE [Azorhizobium sp. AG788]
MTRRLFLLSHGMTPALRAAAFPADEALEAGALMAARALPSVLPRAHLLLCAPERRTRETAEAAGLAALREERLADWDCGRWRGLGFDALAAAEPAAVSRWRNDPEAAPHGGESLLTLLARLRGWIDDLHRERGSERVLAVTHPAVVRAMVVAALDLPPAAFWRLDVRPLTLTELRGGRGGWNLLTFAAPLGRAAAEAGEA